MIHQGCLDYGPQLWAPSKSRSRWQGRVPDIGSDAFSFSATQDGNQNQSLFLPRCWLGQLQKASGDFRKHSHAVAQSGISNLASA